MKNQIPFYVVLASCISIQACSSPAPAVNSPNPSDHQLAVPSFDLGSDQRRGSDVKVTLSLAGRAIQNLYRILYLTSDIQNVSLSLYDSTGTKFPSGGLIKTNSASQTAITASTQPDYFSDIYKTAAGVATGSYDKFMIRQATGSAGFTGSTYAATFKYIKDGSYTLVAEAAEIDASTSAYVSIGRASSSVMVSPANLDSGSYTTITIPTLNMTLDNNPILNATASISNGTSTPTLE